MATTKARSTHSSNGGSAPGAVARAKGAGESVTAAARTAKAPILTAGATAAGLAGGYVLGSRRAAKRRPSGLLRTAAMLGMVAKGVNKVSSTTDEVRQIREQLEQSKRRSPIEVVLEGLTHRRGAQRHQS